MMSELDISPWSAEENGQECWRFRLSELAKTRSNQDGLIFLKKPLLTTQSKSSFHKPIPSIAIKNKSPHINKQSKINSQSAHQILNKCFLGFPIGKTNRPTAKTIIRVSNGVPIERSELNFQTKMKKQIYYNFAQANYYQAKDIKNLEIVENELKSHRQIANKGSKRYSEFRSLRKLNLTHIPSNNKNEKQFSDQNIRSLSINNIEAEKKMTDEDVILSEKEQKNVRCSQVFVELQRRIEFKEDIGKIKRKRMMYS